MNPFSMLSFLTGMFSPWKLMFYAAIAAAGAAAGYKMARNYYEPKLIEANQAIGVITAANTQMKASVETQNQAIMELQTLAQKRESAVAVALAQARVQSEQKQLQAKAVMQIKLPEGVDQCTAAQAAFASQLRQERGVK